MLFDEAAAARAKCELAGDDALDGVGGRRDERRHVGGRLLPLPEHVRRHQFGVGAVGAPDADAHAREIR